MSTICLDAGGFPSTVVTNATGTGTEFSTQFAILSRPDGGPRNLWLSLGPTEGTFSALTIDLQVSFDGGVIWTTQQADMDILTNSQVVSPLPPVGAIMQLNVSAFTGGTSASIVASAN